jgi:hypothetical protein
MMERARQSILFGTLLQESSCSYQSFSIVTIFFGKKGFYVKDDCQLGTTHFYRMVVVLVCLFAPGSNYGPHIHTYVVILMLVGSF